MDRKKMYLRMLKILKNENYLNEYDLAKKFFKVESASQVQIHTSIQILDELERKGYIKKQVVIVNQFISKSGNIFESFENRFSVTIDGLDYLSSSSRKIQEFLLSHIKELFIGVVIGLIIWWLTTKSGFF
ncbi:MAG: hypothetical protein C0433_02260 [Cyclobacterium sp.]|nr:hypothetical protein [Cyclobacterium sp.]